MFKRLKNKFRNWLCGKMPLPELIVEHKKFDLIYIYGKIILDDVRGLSDSDIDELIIRQMIPEIRKCVGFVEIELHDGTKFKQGILKVAKPT